MAGIETDPLFNKFISDPGFQALDPKQKMMALEAQFGSVSNITPDQRFAGQADEAREASQAGEVRQGISPARETAANVFSDYVRPAVETAASIGGGILGTPGGAPGIAGASALAYTGARSGTRGIENLLRGNEQPGLKESALLGVEDLTEGLGYELLPAGIGATLKKVAAPLRSRFLKETIRNKQGKLVDIPNGKKSDLLKLAKKKGIDLLPTDVTKSKTMGIFEKILEGLPISSDIMANFRFKSQLEPLLENLDKLKRSGASNESIEDLGSEIWSQTESYLRKNSQMGDDQLNMVRSFVRDSIGSKKPTSVLAEEAQTILTGKSKIARGERSKAYEKLAAALPDKKIPTPNLAKKSDELLAQIEGLPGQSELRASAKFGSTKAPKELLSLIEGMPKSAQRDILKDYGSGATPRKLDELIKILNESIAPKDALKGLGQVSQTSRTGKHLIDLKNAAIKDFDSFAESTKNVKALRDKAKGLHIDFKETFGEKNIQKLLTSEPKDILKRIVTPGNIKGVKLVKKAMGEDGFKKVQQALTNDLMGIGKDDIWNPEFLRRNLKKYGDDVLNEIYGHEQVKALKDVAKKGFDLTKQKPGIPFLKSIIKKDPEIVVDAIVGSKDTLKDTAILYSNAKQIKKAISKEKFDEIGGEVFRKLTQISKDSKLPQPVKFANAVDKYGDRLKAFFPEETVDELKELSSLSRELYAADKLAGNPSETGRTIMNWSLVQFAMKLPGASLAKWASALLFKPSLKGIANFYTSPAGRKFLTEGYVAPKSVKEAATLAGRLTSFGIGTTLDAKERKKIRENKKENKQ